MHAPLIHKIHNQNFWLSAERCIYWEEEKTLIVSDLHFGKTGHFRKWGIAVPQNVYKEDTQRLINVLRHFAPKKLIVVGDFFHSHANTELEWFKKWRSDFASLEIVLIRGNHDILSEDWYKQAGIQMIEDVLNINSFSFIHDKCEVAKDCFLFCGHIHPGIYLQGAGKQSLRLPCFYFAKDYCILPAFSRFTGLALIEPKKEDTVFAIVENSLVQL